MDSLKKLERLEERLRALLAERDRLRARIAELESGKGAGTDGDGDELRRAHDLFSKEREVLRTRVESLLSGISRLERAG
ncbi:MAG: hypothetical protein ACE5IM_00385 [Nitrospinota bacterium]